MKNHALAAHPGHRLCRLQKVIQGCGLFFRVRIAQIGKIRCMNGNANALLCSGVANFTRGLLFQHDPAAAGVFVSCQPHLRKILRRLQSRFKTAGVKVFTVARRTKKSGFFFFHII